MPRHSARQWSSLHHFAPRHFALSLFGCPPDSQLNHPTCQVATKPRGNEDQLASTGVAHFSAAFFFLAGATPPSRKPFLNRRATCLTYLLRRHTGNMYIEKEQQDVGKNRPLFGLCGSFAPYHILGRNPPLPHAACSRGSSALRLLGPLVRPNFGGWVAACRTLLPAGSAGTGRVKPSSSMQENPTP